MEKKYPGAGKPDFDLTLSRIHSKHSWGFIRKQRQMWAPKDFLKKCEKCKKTHPVITLYQTTTTKITIYLTPEIQQIDS